MKIFMFLLSISVSEEEPAALFDFAVVVAAETLRK
jgi:hypothetical protein